jgi:hypothetical protein
VYVAAENLPDFTAELGPLSSSRIADALLQLEMETIHMDEIFITYVSLSVSVSG